MVYKNAKTALKRYTINSTSSDRAVGPMVDVATRKPIWKHKVLDADGFPFVGAQVHPKQARFFFIFVVDNLFLIFIKSKIRY